MEATLRAKAAEQSAAWLADVISIAVDDESPIYVNKAHPYHQGMNFWSTVSLTKMFNF